VNKYAEKGLVNLTLEDCLDLARMDYDIVVDNGFVIDIIYRKNNTNEE